MPDLGAYADWKRTPKEGDVQGSFTATAPTWEAQMLADAAGLPAATTESPPLKDALVLLVIRSAAERAVLSSLLKLMECRVVEATTYKEAMRVLGWYAVEAIVCEASLADGSWEDILGQIAEMNGAPVVFLALDRQDSAAETRALLLGASGVLCRPFTADAVRFSLSRSIASTRRDGRGVVRPVGQL